MSSQLALTRTGDPDVSNFANAEIAEQLQVATALGAAPCSAPAARSRELLGLNASYLRDCNARPI
jgi:hypothetical protein